MRIILQTPEFDLGDSLKLKLVPRKPNVFGPFIVGSNFGASVWERDKARIDIGTLVFP